MRRRPSECPSPRPWRRLAACAVALGLGALATAQSDELGLPLVRCFPPEQYDGGLQVFDLAQGPDGVLHFASPEDFAVFAYDGERWRKTPIGVSALSLDCDADGRLWIGSNGECGWLGPDGASFTPVVGPLAGPDGQPASFELTRCTRMGVFFLSAELLVLWDGEHATTWRATAEGGFMDLEALGEDVFVLDGQRGLLELVEGQLVESDALGAARVPYDALASDGRRLVGVWLGEAGLNWIGTGDEHASSLAVPELLRGPTYVSDAVTMPDGSLVVSSASGILLLDAQGRFRGWLDDEAGLPNSLAYSLHVDREGAVWAGLAYGLARIDPTAATSFFGAELGLVGTPLVLSRHGGEAYCGTFEGLFRLDDREGRRRFQAERDTPSLPIYDLLSTLHGLLVATEQGLLLLEDERGSLLSETQVLALARWETPDPVHAETVLVATFEGLRVLAWSAADGWNLGAPFPVAWSTDAIAVDERGLWLHSTERALFRLPFDGSFGEPQRIPGEWLGLSRAPTGILAWSRERLCFLADAAAHPEPVELAGLDWAACMRETSRVHPLVDEDGRLWLFDRRSLRRLRGTLSAGIQPEADLEWASPFALEGVQFDELDPNVAWLDTHEGLVRFEIDGLRPAPASAPLLWASVQREGEDWRPFRGGESLPPRASVRAEVAAAVFDGTETSYRYRLDGLERDWSPWTTLAVKEYAGLPGGDYTLHVQARHAGRLGAERELAFGVRAPFYSSAPGLALELLLLASAGFGLLRWRSLRLRRENERLGGMVAERTQDLEAEKRRVLEHTRELERVNQRLVEASEAREVADAARRELHERLTEAERFESLGAVAAGIAHDFNNYLATILGYAELAQDERLGRVTRVEHLEKVVTISQQAAELCSGLLSLTGRAPVLAAPLDLSATVRGMESLLRMSVKDRAGLRLELADELPAVAGDPSQVSRALVNLVINAAEASQGARSPIVVRTAARECTADDLRRMHHAGVCAPGNFVQVEVEDEGVGLAPEALRRIFDPFYSTKFVGRGLGLSTVFRIVASHAGAIDVRSAVGHGTTMRLLFPAAAGVARALSDPALAEPPVALSGRVLVVDDDRRVRELTVRFCRHLGLEVTSAAGGREALELLADREARVDAVILDLSMPEMGGLEVLATLRRTHPGLAVLLVSGYAEPLPREALDDATWFLPKPFTLAALALALQRALRDLVPRPVVAGSEYCTARRDEAVS